MAYNRVGGFSGGYNAYNIPSVKDKPQVAPVEPQTTPASSQSLEEQKENKQEKCR